MYIYEKKTKQPHHEYTLQQICPGVFQKAWFILAKELEIIQMTINERTDLLYGNEMSELQTKNKK